MKQNTKLILLILLLLTLIIFISSNFFTIVYSGTSQTACNTQLKNYCGAGGYYACKSCYKPSTNYILECFSGNNKASFTGTDACQFPQNIVSHTSDACYDNDIYYYNSIGQREEKRTECGTAGCSDNRIGYLSLVKCNPGTPQPPTPPPINLCSGISCPDKCDPSHTQYQTGACDSNTGQCRYQKIITNSPACLPPVPPIEPKISLVTCYFCKIDGTIGNIQLDSCTGVYTATQPTCQQTQNTTCTNPATKEQYCACYPNDNTICKETWLKPIYIYIGIGIIILLIIVLGYSFIRKK